MQGLLPISQTKDKILLLTPNPLQQMTDVCIVCDIIFIPFAYMMYTANEEILGLMLFIGLFAICFTLICFGFKSKFVFDKVRKQMFVEGTNFFIPYSNFLHDFSDIEIIGVQCYEHRGKRGVQYSYDLVYAARQEPAEFKKLATTTGINHVLNFDDINKLGFILSETIGCRFLKGENLRSIQAFYSSGSPIKYTMGGTIRSFLG